MPLFPEERKGLTPLRPPEPRVPDFIPEAGEPGNPSGRIPGFIPEAPSPGKVPDFIPGLAPDSLSPEQQAAVDRVDLLLRKRQAAQTEVERSIPGEVAASLGRGALGLAKLPFEIVKLGGDVLGSETIKKATLPAITSLETAAESPTLKPGKAAGGPPVELDQVLQDPGGVAKQVAANVTNPYFWAAQIPEGALSTIPYFFGSWMARAGATALKYGRLIKAAKTEAEALGYANRLARIGRMGGYGMAMAQEAAAAEQNLRNWEVEKGKEVPWLAKNIVQLAGGAAAGALEAFSLERIFAGKKGMSLVRKLLDSIITEGSTEGAQELVANTFKKYGYDPDQKLTENVVESVLVGAALGGIFGGAEKFAEYRQHVRELREKADAEQQQRQAQPYQPPAVEPWEETPVAPPPATFGPPPGEEVVPPPPYRIIETGERPPVITETEPEGGSPIVDQFGRPIYRSALEVALRKEPWERNALEKWLVDQATRGGAIMPETRGPGIVLGPRGEVVSPAPTQAPMGTSAAETEIATTPEAPEPAMPAALQPPAPDLRTRVSQLAAAVEETGDPGAARELNDLLIANQNEIGDFFRVAEEERPGLQRIADRFMGLVGQVEETGDPAAARELHQLLAAHQDLFSGVARWEVERMATPQTPPEPMAPSAVQTEDMVRPPETPAPEPETPPEAPPVKRGIQGATVPATTARGTTVETQYEVVDIHDLVTSHDDGLNLNPAFPQELQPRERGRAGSQLQVGQIEQNLQPAFLGESPQASEGAPIIGPDNLVESGNARTIALRRLYGRNGAEVYRQWLKENAPRFGVSPDVIDQIQNPVLVRRRLTDLDRQQFVREANEAAVAAMSAVEVARSDAAMLKDSDILSLFVPNERGVVSSAENLPFINRFMERVVGPTERNRFQTSKGLLNQDGERRIRNALFAFAFGESGALEKLAEDPDDNSRNITGAMTMVAPRLALLNQEIAKGDLFPLNLTEEIAQAADIMQSLKDQGVSVEEYLAQQKLFADIDPLVAELLRVFSQFSRSRKKLTNIFNAFADALEALGNPKQLQLLGPKVDITKAELLQAALTQEQGHGEGSEPVPVTVRQGETPSGGVAPETPGKVAGPAAEQEGGPGPAPAVYEEEVEPGFELTGGKRKTTSLETRLKELQDEYPDIDLERAATVIRALPEAENHQVAAMSVDQEMFDQVARGNLSAEERRLLLEKAAVAGQQGVLPGLEEGPGGLFDQEPTRPEPKKPAPTEQKKPPAKKEKPGDLNAAFTDLINRVMEHPNPPGLITPRDVANIAQKALGISNEDLPPRRKEIEEAFEFALVQKARAIVADTPDTSDAFSQLKKLYSLQPALTSRTSTTVRNQAYSTPVPLAYLMSKWAGIGPESWVYEPTAGNGMLLIGANPETAVANEIDTQRADHLKAQGFTVLTRDARNLVGTPQGPQENSMDVVVANPPFGNLDKPVTFDGYKVTKLEHLIALDALQAMDDDGRAALIIGGHSFATPWGQPTTQLTDADRTFFNYLYSRFNVTHHVNIDGKVYERMGTKWPIRLITIEGRKTEPDKAAAPYSADQIEVAKTFDDVYKLLKGEIDARAESTVAPGLPEEKPERPGRPGGPGAAPSGEGRHESGELHGILGDEGRRTAPETGETGTGRGEGGPGAPGAPGGGPVRPGRRKSPVSAGESPQLEERPGVAPGVSPEAEPGPEAGTPGNVPSGRRAGTPVAPGGGGGAGEAGVRGVPGSTVVTPGTKVTLSDGTVVTIKDFSVPTAPTKGEVTLEEIRKAFARAEVRQIDNGFAVTLPNGKVIAILTNQKFEKPSFEELKKDYPQLTREQYEKGVTLGEWRVMSVGGVIALAKGAGRVTLRHEVFHAACDLVLTMKELEAILARYGDWEAAAKAYEVWKPQQPHGLFAKVYHFFRRLAALLKPNAVENVFRRLDRGQVWMRTGTGPGTLAAKLSFSEAPGGQMVEVVDEQGNVRRVPLSQIQGIIDESGKEVKLTDEQRQGLQVVRKGQWVETHEGTVGQVTKIRGIFDKMVLTIQGPRGAVTVKPGEIKNILPAPPGAEPKASHPEEKAAPETKLQVPWGPVSQGPSLHTSVPRYMAEATRSSLQKLESEVSSLDEFVQGRLGYETIGDLHEALGAEQVEGVALAIDAIERGFGGFIIGHQTGVGKGRMVAAMMEYAKKQGKTPIFITADAKLFSDMYRDFRGIKREINPLIIASDKDRARVLDDDGNIIRTLDTAAIQEAIRNMALPDRYDAVFTTYSQFQTDQATKKKNLLATLSQDALVILDESHLGAGNSNRGRFLREDVLPQGWGVVYSSATYAKRPDTMPLYFRTEMGNLQIDMDHLIDNIRRGGVPLQEWIAQQWAQSGQMVRNELSFTKDDGTPIDMPVEMDTANTERDREQSDELTACLRGILKFSQAFVHWVHTMLRPQFMREGRAVHGRNFRGSLKATNFSSVMHNAIAQMQYCLRVEATVKEALAILERGEKVVIGVYNTMESFLEHNVESGQAVLGQPVNMNFADVLRKALNGTMYYKEKDHAGDELKVNVPLHQLPPDLQALYREVSELIDNTTSDVPALPIDAIAKALREKGYRIGEITGRKYKLDKDGNLIKRKEKEKNDKNTPVIKFNNGQYDGLIVNSAASTGLSIHASRDFRDRRPRNMLLTQIAYDIDTVVQLMGRIHRTGQVEYPRYKILISSLPSEKRPLTIFQKKLASLFANVTAKGEAAYSLNIPDVLNQVGDHVVAEMFAENPDLSAQLGVLGSITTAPRFLNADTEARVSMILAAHPENGGLTKKVSGYVAVQPVEAQEEFWANLDARYEERVEHLKQMGEYNLESENVDLQARTIERTLLAQGREGGRSELSGSTHFETVQAKVQRKPLKKADIEKRIADALQNKKPREFAEELKAQIRADFEKWLPEKLALMSRTNSPATVNNYRNRARDAMDFTLDQIDRYLVGRQVSIMGGSVGAFMDGVVYNLRYKPVKGSNPGTPSNVKMFIAVSSTMRQYQTTLSSFGSVQMTPHLGVPEDWDERLPAEDYESRYLVTGNLLANPIDAGRIVYFTREDGPTDMGFLMPLNFNPGDYSELQRVTLSKEQALRALERNETLIGWFPDVQGGENIMIRNLRNGTYNLSVAESRKGGGRFYLDDDIREHVRGNDFYSAHHRMEAIIESRQALEQIIDLLDRKHQVYYTMDRSTFDRLFGGWQQASRARRQFVVEGADQETIDQYREKYVAAEPEEPKKGLKERITRKLQKFYDQAVDRWASWERTAERAAKQGAYVPLGENIVNNLSYLRGCEGRARQGIVGDFVYQDKKTFDEDLGMEVFTGDELVKKGPSLKNRLEDLKKLADRRGLTHGQALDDLETFMVAQRDLELACETGSREPGSIKGVHPEESNALIEAMKRKYGEDFDKLAVVADSIREWGDEMILQPLLQVGFIDQETYDKIKDRNQYYIPYKRLLDDVENYIAANAAAMGVPGRVIQELKGSERKVLNPMQMWIELAHKAVYAYAKNKTIRSMYVTARAAQWEDVKEVPAKYLPVDFQQKQEIDAVLRPQLTKLANDLGIKVKVVAKLRGRRLGQFKSWLKEEVKGGKLSVEEAKEIEVRFATFESTLAHELGHGIDEAFGLVKLLIENGTPEMKKELRRIADQRAGDAASKSYKRYIRKKEEQVAEFVSRYIIDKRSVERLAPTALAVFEGYLKQNPRLTPLLKFKLSHVAGMMDFTNRIWARSPLPPELGTIPYFRDGKQRWLKLPPDLYQATQSAMPSEMGILMRVARFPADTLRAGAILVPEFALARNPARDIVQAWIFSRFGFNPFKWVRDAAGLISNDQDVKELQRQWEAGGGPLSTLAQSFVEPEKITVESIMGDKKKFKYFAHPIDALRFASAYLENLTRFSIYRQAREKGLSHVEAVHEARRTTLDYGRSGGHPTARYLNMIIPFWNASIQGMDKLITELTGPNKWAVYRRLGMLGGLSVLIWLYAHQDDRYKELEDWEKNYFWHLPLGPKAPMIRIPKPFEAGILFGSTFERLFEWGNGENIKGLQSALKAAWDAATPEVIPTIARPYVENWSNYDFFRSRSIEDSAMQRLPVQLRAKPWTTATAKAVSKLTQPVIDISPIKLEHFIRTWTGGLGSNYFLPGVDVVLRKAGVLEDIPQPARDKVQEIWGMRTFFTQTPTGYRAKSVNDFFERYQEVIQADAGWKALWNAGQTKDLDKFLADHPEAMFARVALKYMNEMGKIKKERRQIHLSKTLTSDQKKERLDLLDDKIVRLAKAANAFMSQVVAEALKMPSRFVSEAGIRKTMDIGDYYKMVAESTTDAWEEIKNDPRFFAMEEEARNKRLSSLLRQMREEYAPVKKATGEWDEIMKPFRFKSLFGQPTRKQRAEMGSIFGPRKRPPLFY